jgi:REP element-mobilizing transposase RayT
MARQWRIEYPDALYHVLSRGNGRQDIFLSDQDRHTFVELLQEVYERYSVDICAYVLMRNHYHLLLRTPEANLSRAMQWFGTTFTRRFHMHNRTSGHLFQGRFKCILVENDAYLLQLSCYIHRNPLRAGIIDRLADYPWSSYPYYAYKKMPPVWLDTDRILNQLTTANRHAAYRKKIQRYSDEEGCLWEDVKYGLAYGSQDFLDQLKERFMDDRKNAELPQHNRLLMDANPQELAEKAALRIGLDLRTVRRQRRIPNHDRDKRDMLIYFLWETGKLSNQSIAALLGLTYSNISRRVSLFRANMDNKKRLKSNYNRIKSQIKV